MANVVETSSSYRWSKEGSNDSTHNWLDTHDGRSIVPVYDWATYLGQHFKKIAHIKKYHHFRFSKEKPGIVYCKECITSPEK